MQTLQLLIIILQSINVLITLIFFTLFSRRLCKIRQMSTTNKYLDKNWLIRIILAIVYILLSASMLAIELDQYVNADNWIKQLLMSGSIGFCINSLVLMIHIAVISQQLRKQLPFTRLHQNFLIYLLFISACRLIVVTYEFCKDSNNNIFQIGLFCLAILLQVCSLGMIGFWIWKKKTLPTFDDLTKFDINTITQRIISPNFLFDHNSIYPQKSTSSIERWNLIIPNVTVQLGKVHIILQMAVDDQILKSLAQTQQQTKLYKQSIQNTYKSLKSFTPIKQKQHHLQIISDYHYSISQIKTIYLSCSRFELQTIIKFNDISMADFYRQIKKYIQQLFTIKQAHINQIFELFHIDNQSKQDLHKRIQKLNKNQNISINMDMLVSNYIDLNSMFLSVQIYKQLWVEDHFIFYIQTISMQQKQFNVCYKRYSDFQQFHSKLQNLVNLQHKSLYKLPSLPKKHFFSLSQSDSIRTTQRRKQLQKYCQQTFNDYFIMTKMPRARQLILNFLQLKKTFDVIPVLRKAQEFYDGLQIKRGNIYKALVQDQYVTFYQFSLYRNGILLRNILKRFRQFVALHQSLQRWMENSQILYKFIVLPQKHLYKSQSKRHQKLIHYLQNTLTIKDTYKIYAVNKFFNMGHHYDMDNSGFGMSMIKKHSSDLSDSSDVNMDNKKQQSRKTIKKQINQIKKQEQFSISMESDRQRMSLMIQQLGD